VRGFGDSKAEAFRQAALALIEVITEPERVQPLIAVEMQCASPDDELLLADWLNTIVTEMSIRSMLFGEFDVSITDHRLAAVAWGERVERERHQPRVEVKGATYTALSVSKNERGEWVAGCVVDV
jgi:tRNA nucleotidyltransferase (CCA-adding enzyme)